MGTMKELYTALQESERLLREYDPLAAEAGQRLVEHAQSVVLAQAQAQVRALLSREHPLPTSF